MSRVGHQATPDASTGRCAHDGCDRQVRLYGDVWQHVRGFGGRDAPNPRTNRTTTALRRTLHDAQARIALLEAENARLRRENQPWVGLHARLERIERALLFQPTHRRIKDGGIGGKEERRRRAAAA